MGCFLRMMVSPRAVCLAGTPSSDHWSTRRFSTSVAIKFANGDAKDCPRCSILRCRTDKHPVEWLQYCSIWSTVTCLKWAIKIEPVIEPDAVHCQFFHPPWFCRPAPGISPSIVRGHREPRLLSLAWEEKREKSGMDISGISIHPSYLCFHRDRRNPQVRTFSSLVATGMVVDMIMTTVRNAVTMLRWFLASRHHHDPNRFLPLLSRIWAIESLSDVVCNRG